MVKQKVLITGISGFAGSHLAEYLISQKSYEVAGTFLLKKSLGNVAHVRQNLHLIELNLVDYKKTSRVVKELKPDLVFHLAALPAVASSFKNPAETMINNITAQINILEAIKKLNLFDTRILIVSSADVYGKVPPEELPMDENTAFRPTNTYAVSKIAQDFLGLQYCISYLLKIIRVRPFNHIGPRQSAGFVVSDFAKKIADIEKGRIDPILRVGNLQAKRDFTDVRDMVRAYNFLLEKGEFGEVYNIGSGVSYNISEILDILLSFSKIKIKVETDHLLLRPEDVQDRLCDNKKFVELTGWKPSIPIKKSLKDTLDYWRNID